MKNILIIIAWILVCVFPGRSESQDLSPVFEREIPFPVTYFTTNLAGEFFLITSDNLLKKYNINGDSVGVYNEVRRFGRLSYVAAQNTWKTLLYYEGFQTIVLLDKYMKYLGNINLRDKDIFNVKAVANSYDNQIWVFDGREYKIKKLDDNGNLLMASIDFRQLFDDVPTPRWIADSEDFLYLYDPDKGFYIFDHYGAFKTILPFKNWKSVRAVKKNLVGFDDNFFYRYTPPVPLAGEFQLPAEMKNADQIEISQQKIFVLKDRRLKIFKI